MGITKGICAFIPAVKAMLDGGILKAWGLSNDQYYKYARCWNRCTYIPYSNPHDGRNRKCN